MIKMLKILPARIKTIFIVGAFLVLIYVLSNIFLPNLIGSYIKLMISKKGEPFTISFFNNLIAPQSWQNVPYDTAFKWLTVAIVVQTLVTALLALLSTIVIIYASEESSYFYRVKLFNSIQKLSLKNIADLKSESIITRVSNDIAIFWEFLVNGTTIMIKGIFLIMGGIVFSFLVDWKMALTIVAIIPVVAIMVVIIGITTSPLLKKTQKVVEEVTKTIGENISGIRLIKTYNLEEKRMNKITEINSRWHKIQYKQAMIFNVAFPIFFMVLNLLMIGIFSIAANNANFLKSNGLQNDAAELEKYKILIANINIFVDYLFLMAGGIILMLMFLGSFFKARVASLRIIEIIEYKVDDLYVKEGKILQNYDIEVNKLSFKYYETAPNYSLLDVNFKIPFGKTLGIIGPTGSGKSTLVNLLMNNYIYSEGSIKVGGEELREINTKNLHDSLGIIYQDALLYSGTIKSNLLFAKENATEEEIKEALENACASEFISKFEDGINHPVSQGGRNLSGGQKQRISIARTLLRKPKVLILDDSTSALDNITTKKVIDNIRNKYDCTTIIVSQKIGAIKNADNILVLSNNGFVLDQGTHNKLLETCDFYKQIYETQLEQ
ncbi:ABC-type multidrug/protein/lipid transport system ATPase component [Mycoplasmopsis maculosa]|uniref:ABC-type multidrug/protein/lipid transport system ATPase component n=1 Tax=Mycoplasmopsis maculosa TaxID=114885 RepID=A0A449B4B0_9BACT|nr:ABC transporter ATP-binding protein [Mycoplasmopsis maculosa]VEU75441.1 ABC-type multidrug/protein/lipid transport system ATPase component [Mycoplasmopsis maculosa]